MAVALPPSKSRDQRITNEELLLDAPVALVAVVLQPDISSGLYKLSYDGACPATSKTLWWNKRVIDERMLIDLLLFEVRPDNPARRNDKRINHHAEAERDDQQGLIL